MTDAERVMELIRCRRSIRRFRPEPIERKTIEQLLEAASWAPSAGNRQDWMFTVVTSDDLKGRMAQAVRRRWEAIIAANRGRGFIEEVEPYASHFADFAQAPVVIAVSCRTPDAVQEQMLGAEARATVGSFASAAMAAQNLMLAAQANGLGSCCMTGALAASDELLRLLELGRRRESVCLVAIGRPALHASGGQAESPVRPKDSGSEGPPAPPRKALDETARFME